MPRTSNDTLTPERLALFASMLREQQSFRREQIRGFADTAPVESEAEAEVASILRRGAFAALAEIEAALTRMDLGTYGRCTVCGGAVGIERLEVIPQTARCITCERHR